MKKFFFFLSTIALLGLASACVEQISSDNPNYNAEKGEVKTSFVINIANTAQTKATAADVQIGSDFRGMEGIRLFMSKAGYAGAYETGYVYDLGTMTDDMVKYESEKNLTESGAIDENNSRRVYNMAMPIGVNEMVFYAKAPTAAESSTGTSSDATTPTKKLSKNQITYPFKASTTTSGDPRTNADIKFSLVPVTANDFDITTDASAIALLNILNDVANVNGWKNTDDVTLATAYANYITTQKVVGTQTVYETLRQGSADAVKRTMEDLYTIVTTRSDALSAAIKAAILGNNNANFTAVEPSGTARATLTYNNSAIKTNFPENLGLPVGAAQVQCAVTSDAVTFSYVSPTSNTIAVTGYDGLNYRNLMNPAELCYWASSPIRVSTIEGVPENEPYYPKNWSVWDADANWLATYGWLPWSLQANNAITKDTRAVALKNNVLYGNALAEFIVAKMRTSYKDNRNKLVPNLVDQDIAFDGSNKYFKITGILIGGQPKTVDWNFIAVDGTPDRSGVVYDNTFDATITTGTSGNIDPLYVMVLDNYNPDQKDVVYFALELENHAGDFYGKDNVIYDGGKFYLAGKLDLAAQQGVTPPDLSPMANYRIPPVTGAGVAAKTNQSATRIFIQDFKTTINVTLGTNVLKNAYATIPDLRKIDMYLGLSVDLSWKAGAALSVEL
jgi:hypothetical protein